MQNWNQRTRFDGLPAALLMVSLVSISVTVQGAHPSPTPDQAFAVIGPSLVKENYHQYSPFYSNVIAPHAVVEKGRIFCAFQNTKAHLLQLRLKKRRFWVHKDDNAARVRPGKPHPWRPLKYPGLHEAVYRYNMYYILRDAKGVWRNIEGKKVELPVSKAFADKHCLVFDSGDEFTNIGRPVIDKNNKPFVRFRYGVGDWKKGGKRIIPWQSRYANYDGDKWQVYKNIQQSWPEKVQTLLSALGPIAWGDQTDGNWFIFYKHIQNSGSHIFLYHETTGYASRTNGPAQLP